MLLKKYSEETQALCAGCSKAGPQTNKQTNKQTNTKTDRGDYNTLRSLARSVINVFCLAVSTYCYTRKLGYHIAVLFPFRVV